MAATDLSFHGIVTGLSDGEGPRLMVTTASGRVRDIPLTRPEIMRLLRQSVAALEELDREEDRARRARRDGEG